MELQYFLPREDLQGFVRVYYYFATDTPAVLPVCAELGNIRVLLNGAGRLQMPDGKYTAIAAAFLIGPTSGAYKMDAQAGTRVFGVGIRPRGWGALLGINAAETANRVFDLTAIAGHIAGYAIEEIRNAANLQEMAAAADRFFLALMERRASKACTYPQAFEQWLLNPNDLDLDCLVEMMDVSRRQTDRVAKQFFGASPKVLQRKYRALRAADRIRAGDTSWLNAAGHSYYDQSHFIQEFKTFIGVTPGQFFSSQAAIIAEIQAKRRTATIHHPLASL